MSAIKIIQAVAKKSLTKNQGSGIINLPGAMQSEAKAGEIVALLQKAGIPMNQLDDFIRSEADVLKFLNIIEAASKPKVYSGQAAIDQLDKLFPKKGEVVQFPQKTSFKEQVESMKKSGDIVDPNNLKKNDKVLQRDMFNNSNLNKTDTVADTISYIKTLEPVKAMKEANSIIGRKGKYKNLTPEESKKILTDTEDHIFQRDPDNLYDYDPEDMAKGGRAGYAVGNQVMPAVDARMNVDYNTLVDQNTAQRGFMDNWRNHAIATQAMRGKVSGTGLKDGETIPNYGMQSGYDFKKNFQDMNPKVAAGLSLGYQGLTEGLGMFNPNNPNFLNPIKTGKTIYNDYQKNVEGILGS